MTTTDPLAKLEFGEILRRLATHCNYSLAAARALEIGPSRDRKIVRYLLDVTAEAVSLRSNCPTSPSAGPATSAPNWKRRKRGAGSTRTN